jgi:hypothetical protein
MELENKYLVLKWDDLNRALTPYELKILDVLIDCVQEYREYKGKKENSYVVINRDEPYFPDVLKLMEEAQS